MSRIGKLPVTIPSGVEVKIKGTHVDVKGPKGELKHTFPPVIEIKQEGSELIITRKSELKFDRSMHGTARSLIQNMVTGVSDGFVKELEIQGVGYRCEMNGKDLVLHVGYSHPVSIEAPEGITFEVTDKRGTNFKVSGFDKQVVGQISANIREVRPPEPYKGKGIRYKGEYVRIKPGKSSAAA